MGMEIEFDPRKNAANIALGRPSFEAVSGFDFDTAMIVIDDRRDYGETRYRALGIMGAELAVVVFTMRGAVLRVISLRLANRKEKARYGF